ncbi:MAG: T9SS type A sorting domain-containing protein, partial [Hymenobacteraceae bacterium]|nr:T9SS type A sorting domain-containing protein [Hymenobacteraceae bacterium]
SVRLRLNNTMGGGVYDLVSPNIIPATTLQRPYLYFERAYARRTAADDDRLTMSTSFDCGRTWITRGGSATRSATQLQTGATTGVPFVPTASEWRTDSLLITTGSLAAGSHVMVRFRMLSDRGNAIYLDNLRLGPPTLGLAAEAATGVSLTPNPLTPETGLQFSLTRPSRVALRVSDLLGRAVLTEAPRLLAAGTHHLPLAARLRGAAAGVYIVSLELDGRVLSQKLLIQ